MHPVQHGGHLLKRKSLFWCDQTRVRKLQKHSMEVGHRKGKRQLSGRSRQYRQYDSAALSEAFISVKDAGMAVKKAARVYCVPETTLRERVNGTVDIACLASGPSPMFSQEQEARLVQHTIASLRPRRVRGPGMRLPQSSSPRITKSSSAGMIEHEDVDLHIVDQDDIIGLTQDVKNFSDGLVKLKAVFNECVDCDEDIKVLAHERLGDVLCTLKNVLHKYPPLNSTELFSAAGTLISKIKSYNYEDHSHENIEQAFSDAIDQLALAFSSSVSEYLMGDSGIEEEKTKSYDNLMSSSQESRQDDTEEEKEEAVVHLSPEQIDATLMNLQAGLDIALQRAKAWSKYLKDVMTYIDRRAQMEVEYSKNLSRLAVSMKPILTEETEKRHALLLRQIGFLPLQSVYCTVFSQDIEYSKTCQATFTLLQTTKFIEPLTVRRSEHDKARKTLKDNWNKEYKKMQETVNNLRKAQTLYTTRQQEYDKAKELAIKTESDLLSQSSSGGSVNLQSKVDKRKKSEEDAMHKAMEAETTYKACVAEANSRQQEIMRIKSNFLTAVWDQILLSDQTIKKVTVEYFQLLQTVSAPVPVQYHTLCEASKKYQAGSQYGEYVRRLPVTPATTAQDEEYKFESYQAAIQRGDIQNRKVSTQSNESASSDHHSGDGSPQLSSRRGGDKYRVAVKAWGQNPGFALGSDTDSASGSSKSLDSSPSNSPYPTGRRRVGPTTGSMEDLIEADVKDPAGVKQLLAVPGTEQVDAGSLMKRQGRRRNTTFGVDFQEQVEHYHSAVPPIISKCLMEVERRGISLKGIYRVSGVKSRVEALCQRFELDPQSVELSSENPNVISNVLKLYLRQLPEPLLTFKQYQRFVQVAKENMGGGSSKETMMDKLHELVDNLPFSNRKTCGVLMHHLQKVAAHSDQNQMNASNLGIVFGPTLLRPQGGNASLACLVDTPHQTRVVELLIVSAQTLFGPRDDHDITPAETLIEEMPDERLAVPSQPHPKIIATLEPKDEPKIEGKKPLKVSHSVPLPVEKRGEALMPSMSTDCLQAKPSGGEEFSLPGCTNYDNKDMGGVVAHLPSSEGEDVPYELDSQFDEDLPDTMLPDDSIPVTGNSRLLGTQRSGFMRQQDNRTSTPHLPNIHYPTDLSLPTTSSSHNLSPRGAVGHIVSSTPPVITVYVEDNSTQASLHTSFPLGAPNLRAAIIAPELPPINDWVPKGESLFNGILDTRSPQVYRRTNASKSQSSNQPAQGQGSRGSWPPPGASAGATEGAIGDNSTTIPDDDSQGKKSSQFPRSPQLLQKWSSFDQERSKPFPARSSMSSPLLKRRSANFTDDVGSDSDGMSETRPKSEGSTESSCSKGQSGGKLVRQVTIEDRLSVYLAETVTVTADPYCTAVPVSETETVIVSSPVVKDSHLVSVHETSLNSLASEEGELLVATKLCPDKHSSVDELESPVYSQSVAAARKSLSSISEGSDRPAQPKTVAGNGKPLVKEGKSKSGGKAHTGPIMGKAGLSPSCSSSEKSSSPRSATSSVPRSATSSVKSALMSSAAKLKSIGKKNTITLLSYRSDSITIPKSGKKPRPERLHSLPERSSPRESKKTSYSSSKSESDTSEYANRYHITQSDSALSSSKSTEKKPTKPVSTTPPVLLSVGGLRKSSSSKSSAPSLGVGAVEKIKKTLSKDSSSSPSAGKKAKSKSESGSKGPRQDTGVQMTSKAAEGERSKPVKESRSSVSSISSKSSSPQSKTVGSGKSSKSKGAQKDKATSSMEASRKSTSTSLQDCCNIRSKQADRKESK